VQSSSWLDIYIYRRDLLKIIWRGESSLLPKYSTVHQLLEMYNCIEKKEISCFVLCDFSKAFDKVWHKGLIHKIKSYGVDSNLLNWFSSYLQVSGEIHRPAACG
jgi:hypothetical protein